MSGAAQGARTLREGRRRRAARRSLRPTLPHARRSHRRRVEQLVRRRRPRAVRALGPRQPAGPRDLVAAGRAASSRCRTRQSVPVGAVPLVGGDVRSRRLGPGRAGPRWHATRARTYAVLTTKHHVGLLDVPHQADPTSRSSTRPTAATSSREFVDALRAEGLRVGLYYSLSDWHRPRLPGVHRGRQAVPARLLAARPPARAVGAFLDVSVRAGPRAAHRLRPDRPAVVRRRVGAPAAEWWRPTSSTTMIRSLQPDILDQRPAARLRRLRDARAVRAPHRRPAARGRRA